MQDVFFGKVILLRNLTINRQYSGPFEGKGMHGRNPIKGFQQGKRPWDDGVSLYLGEDHGDLSKDKFLIVQVGGKAHEWE